MSTLASVVLRDVIANLPTAGIPGRVFYSIDTLVTLRDNGTSWDNVSSAGTPVTLQTNGTNNSSQTTLNLQSGIGIAVSNTSGGNVAVSNNGLSGTALTSSNFVLGTGAGSGATINSVAGTDGNHKVSITFGSSPVASQPIYTCNYSITRDHVSYPVVAIGDPVSHTGLSSAAGLVTGESTTSYAYSTPSTFTTSLAGITLNLSVVAP